jgi:hypothetical protein
MIVPGGVDILFERERRLIIPLVPDEVLYSRR